MPKKSFDFGSFMALPSERFYTSVSLFTAVPILTNAGMSLARQKLDNSHYNGGGLVNTTPAARSQRRHVPTFFVPNVSLPS